MQQKFKRKPTKNTRSAYNYKPQKSLGDEEKGVYRRVLATIIVIIIISVGLYLWGIELVIGLSNVWRVILPGSQVIDLTNSHKTSEPLFAPRLDPIPLYTQEKKIDIKGWSQQGLEVKVFLNDEEQATILADKNGRFEYSGANLIEGANKLQAISLKNDSESEPSELQTIKLDTKEPELSVEFNEEKVEDEGKLEITGQTEETAIVFINDHRVILQTEGKFSDVYQLEEGSNKIVVKVVDQAGNETTVERAIEYERLNEEGEENTEEVE